MEVHHHSHSSPAHGGASRKKWTHYFWEFLMLFLAVFCGFLAEYQLEHKIERDREKVYIKNLYKDLQADTAIFQDYVRTTSDFAREVDSLIYFMKSETRNLHLSEIYYYARNLTISNINTMYPSQATFSQLKYSGQLRLIHNQKVANAISLYYLETDQLNTQNDFILTQVAHYWEQAENLFDGNVFYEIRQKRKPPDPTNLRLMTNDPALINKFLVSTQYYYGSRIGQKERADKMLQNALALMNLIKTEYRLD